MNPHGLRVRDAPRRKRGNCDDMVSLQRRNGIMPGTEALLPGWDGDRLDLGYAVDVMFDFTAPPDDPQPPFASTG